MVNRKWNGKKYAAACLGSGMMLAALAMSQNYQNGTVMAAEETQTEKEVSLAIAGREDAQDAETQNAQEESQGSVKLSVAEDKTDGADAQAAAENGDAQSETAAENGDAQSETAAENGDAQSETADENGEVQTEAPAENTEEETQAETSETEVSLAEAAPDEMNALPETAETFETLETTVTGEEGIMAMDVSGIVENCMPSIVAITNKSVQEVQGYFYGSQKIESQSAGSGIIIAQNDTELMIATNKHVVEDAKEMTVCFTVDTEDPEDAVVPAVTKGTDAEHDLAVVAVKLSDIPSDVLSQLKIATLGSSDHLKVGETAIAIGNALGTGQTVTSGIISALEREITTDVGTFTELQTDAAINFGCSGGALLNKRGEVIGINSAKATGDYAESMGYAIPIDAAIPVLSNLINRETREVVDNHGYMGITVVPVSDEAKEMYNMPAGAFVYEVTEGSAGEKAGLKKGDIITKFDGISIDSSDTLVSTLGFYKAGETVTLEVQQAENGAYVSRDVEVTLQEGAPETVGQDAGNADGQGNDSQGNDGQMMPDENGEMTIPYGEVPYDQFGGDFGDGFSNGNGMGDFYNFFNGGNGFDGRGFNGYN